MKILYVTALNETINAFLIPHIEMLVNDDNKVDCACNINMDIDKRLKECGVSYYNINFSRNPIKINYLKVIRDIKEVYKKNKYDIVHVHTPIASFLTRFALRNYNVKVIYTAHGFHFFKGAPLLNWFLYYPLERIAAHWTDKLVTINSEDYERAKTFKLRKNGQVILMHGVGINPEEYILDGFDRDSYRKKLGVNEGDFMLLILADINKNKNHIQVIKAINDLKNTNPNIKVICAGEGPLKEKLIKKVNKLGLDTNIKFIGFRRDVKELINSCDCVGLFSMREGLPKSLMEAMCCGKSIVTSNIRGCRDLGESTEVGKLVNPKKYKSIVKGIRYIVGRGYDSEKIKKTIRNYDLSKVLKEVSLIHKPIQEDLYNEKVSSYIANE